MAQQVKRRDNTSMWREIDDMRHQTVGQLKAKYREVFGDESRSNHKQFLIRRIAWRLQANAEGSLSERALIFGTAALSPITAAGHSAQPWQEGVVTFGFMSVGIIIVACSLLVLWGSTADHDVVIVGMLP